MRLYRTSALQVVAVTTLLFAVISIAAAPSEPVYAVDLTRYFPTPDAERAAREPLFAAVKAFGARHPNSDRDLDDYLRAAAQLQISLERHEEYWHLKAAIDTADSEARQADDDTTVQLSQLSTLIDATLQRVASSKQFADSAKHRVISRPVISRYGFLIEQARRKADHTLPADQQLILDRLSVPTLSALFDLYQQTINTTPFGTLSTPAGERDIWAHRRALTSSPDRAIRQRESEGLLRGFNSRAATYAGILLEIVRERERIAQLTHFDDAPSAAYFKRFQTPREVKSLLASVERHADLCKAYQTLLAEHISAATGVSAVRSWDLAAPLGGFTAPQFGIDQVRTMALQALAPLGAEYQTSLSAMLDPRNGRADIAAGTPTRYRSGFSVAVPGIDSALYVGDFQGSLRDANTVVHEGGHAVHGQLLNEHVSSPLYANGPNWLSEAFAILNELLLYDHLYRTSIDPHARTYYLAKLIDDIAIQIFTSAQEGSLEQAIYEGVAAGRVNNAADLDALTATIWNRYEIWSEHEPDRKHLWMTKQLMFEDPLYLVNYLYAGLLATKMYAMAGADAADFSRRYLPLLKDGYYAQPEVLLRNFFGHPQPLDQLVDQDMTLLKSKIDELAVLYRQLE